jgi:hypothetical protein
MKLVRINHGEIGLLVELPTGPHAVDLAKSLGVFAAHDPVSGGLINGALKEKSAWAAIIKHWHHLRMPLKLLVRIVLADPDDPRLVLRPFVHGRQAGESSAGIVALDITDVADLDMNDPTGRLVMARQFGEAAAEDIRQDTPPIGENAEVIDFVRHNNPRIRRE